MSGRRLLDVVAILNASRGVAGKHLALRRNELNVFTKSSSLAQSIILQRERATRTVDAALALARRLNETSPKNASQSGDSTRTEQDITIPSRDKTSGPQEVSQKQGLAQDHFYSQSEANTVIEPAAAGNLGLHQEKAKADPLPDGTTPLAESSQSTSETEAAKRLQRQAEQQIPSQAAEPPPTSIADSETAKVEGLNVDQEQDVFSSPPKQSGPVLSALPRVKLPKNAEDRQSTETISDSQHLNQDVFYSSAPEYISHTTVESQSAESAEQLPEEAYAGLFQSPKVAKMLRGDSGQESKSKAPTSKEIEKDLSSGTNAANGDLPNPASGSTDQQNTASDVHQLAADMAADTQRQTATASPPPQDLTATSPGQAYEMRESRVPSSRFGRLWQYGGLATSMAFGAAGESFRRIVGSPSIAGGSLVLSAANMERLVAKLSRMRGAALKLGQMMSFQDSKMLPGPINEVLQRVQDSADFMPPSQRNKVLVSNLGAEWRNLFSSFDEKPMAAASIGQVHKAVLTSTGQEVAVKVQYPGVASSIDSDLSNLSILLTASRLLPKGLYLDKTIANARTELAWECDYIREAEMGDRFRKLLHDESDVFHVPAVIKEASGPEVLTAEYCSGTAVTKLQGLAQDQRDWIGTNILRLCLREITDFKFMQTDPNWTNFLFNSETKKLELLDFGASRDYPDKFILPYVRNLLAASQSNREAVRDLSIELGYLTGHESQAMVNAHVNSVLTLAEPFMETAPEVYDFQDQTITDRVRSFIPVMLRERLSPPPEETYSLHRKLSGAFLLCARLGSRVKCREMFANAMRTAGVL